jgi:colanic acid/amylovoran biosynthesis glycosyltransferase
LEIMKAGAEVAYIVGGYPAVSHTFVTREVLALRAAGARVETISIHRAEDADLLSDLDRAERESTYALLPVRLGDLAGAHLRAMARPGAYLDTLLHALRSGPPGLKARARQLFYFAEGVMVWRHCRRRRIRHIHAHHLNQASDAAMVATRYANARGSTPPWTWSFTIHGPNEFYDVSRFGLAEKAGSADAIVCISDFARSQVMAFAPEARWPRMRVVHCGLDPTQFDSAPGPGPGATDALRVLYVGRLVAFKGQAILLEAIASIRARGIDASLTVIGEGPSRQALERRTGELGLAGVVAFAGAVGQDEIRSHYAAADVFCLPSFAEGVPVVLMEAMAMRVPVVTSRVMGITELVEDGEDGLLVRPGRADELAVALERLGRDPELRRRLGERAREKVVAEFDVRESGRRLARLFAAVESEGNGDERV